MEEDFTVSASTLKGKAHFRNSVGPGDGLTRVRARGEGTRGWVSVPANPFLPLNHAFTSHLLSASRFLN